MLGAWTVACTLHYHPWTVHFFPVFCNILFFWTVLSIQSHHGHLSVSKMYRALWSLHSPLFIDLVSKLPCSVRYICIYNHVLDKINKGKHRSKFLIIKVYLGVSGCKMLWGLFFFWTVLSFVDLLCFIVPWQTVWPPLIIPSF